MSYISASGQIERGPDSVPSTSEARPRKRAKTADDDDDDDGGDNPSPSAFAKPPDWIKSFYKRYQKLDKYALAAKVDLVDCDPAATTFTNHLVKKCEAAAPDDVPHLMHTFSDFLGRCVECDDADWTKCSHPEWASPPVYEVHNMPGLVIYPNLLPPKVQLALLDKLLHRDLSNPDHQTNLHLHYDMPYPAPTPHPDGTTSPTSFFSPAAQHLPYPPKHSHAPLTTPRLLTKKLRWLTLGGQYDWTAKAYPADPAPPPFPPDLKRLLDRAFPPMRAEAAIVNLYSPGDTLSVHRDVSEACAQPLVSISLGCEAVFVCGLDGEGDGDGDGEGEGEGEETTAESTSQSTSKTESEPTAQKQQSTRPQRRAVVPVKLRSGDAMVMRGPARWAWHGVPKVLAGTCPAWLRGWPAGAAGPGAEQEERFPGWEGWMAGKRVNLNVRQVFGG